jgi:hypothetical protein
MSITDLLPSASKMQWTEAVLQDIEGKKEIEHQHCE